MFIINLYCFGTSRNVLFCGISFDFLTGRNVHSNNIFVNVVLFCSVIRFGMDYSYVHHVQYENSTILTNHRARSYSNWRSEQSITTVQMSSGTILDLASCSHHNTPCEVNIWIFRTANNINKCNNRSVMPMWISAEQ